jgi:hypothetical protein
MPAQPEMVHRAEQPYVAIRTLIPMQKFGEVADFDVIRAWWSLRSLQAVRWLVEHGFDPWRPECEVDVLRSQL